MIGDKMMLYDRENDLFFAGYKATKNLKANWCESSKHARVLSRLSEAYRLKEELGLGVRIVSETEARKIDALREYREMERCKSTINL